MPLDAKQCLGCKKVLPLDQFHRRGANQVGYRSRCKLCAENARNTHRAQNRDKYNEAARRWRRENRRGQLSASLRWRFGITIEEYEDMLNAQSGACAICLAVPESSLHVDHDHETGKIRGLLCGPCNRMLGQAGDRVQVLYSAIAYLERA